LHCIDGAGHAKLDIAFEDDDRLHEAAMAKFSFCVLAADIDRFVVRLRKLEQEQSGDASLPMAL
jgi:hypothetical protein